MASFSDFRPRLGTTSTLLMQYLQAADVEPPLSLATALFYGIKTITMRLSRDTSPADAAAYSYFQPRIDDVLSRRCCYSASAHCSIFESRWRAQVSRSFEARGAG